MRFGPFEVDLRSRELRKSGMKLRLPGQPFQVLVVLLEHSGDVVTREALRSMVWPGNSFGDIDHALNKAIARLREVLGDCTDTPRFVETLPRLGYRFIGPVENIAEIPREVVPNEIPPRDGAISHAGRSRQLLFGLALLLAASGVLFVIGSRVKSPRHAAIHSLAILPFENLSGDPAQDYLADGMTDEVIAIVSRSSGLRVISRTSVMPYRKMQRSLPEIARELGVDAILQGSARRDGSRIHATAQLISVNTGKQVWAESYDRNSKDIGSLQNELAQAVVEQTGVTVLAASSPRKSVSPEAYDAYMLGKYYAASGKSEKARECFRTAIELQPDYAAPWSGLSRYYGGIGVVGRVRSDEVRSLQEATARKALELDDSLPEAHNDMAALYYFFKWDWPRADRESARAIELNPSYAEGHHIRGYVLQTLNHPEEALREQKLAMALDPLPRPDVMVVAFIQARQFDAAVKDAQLRVEAQPESANRHGALAAALWFKGMEKEAAEELETSLRLNGDKDSALMVHRAFARGGYRAVLESQLKQLKKDASERYVSPMEFANIYGDLKRKDEALSYLEAAYQERSPKLVHIQHNPHLYLLHAEPRYQAIVKKMGLRQVD